MRLCTYLFLRGWLLFLLISFPRSEKAQGMWAMRISVYSVISEMVHRDKLLILKQEKQKKSTKLNIQSI